MTFGLALVYRRHEKKDDVTMAAGFVSAVVFAPSLQVICVTQNRLSLTKVLCLSPQTLLLTQYIDDWTRVQLSVCGGCRSVGLLSMIALYCMRG
jgi:hypothetical protein